MPIPEAVDLTLDSDEEADFGDIVHDEVGDSIEEDEDPEWGEIDGSDAEVEHLPLAQRLPSTNARGASARGRGGTTTKRSTNANGSAARSRGTKRKLVKGKKPLGLAKRSTKKQQRHAAAAAAAASTSTAVAAMLANATHNHNNTKNTNHHHPHHSGHGKSHHPQPQRPQQQSIATFFTTNTFQHNTNPPIHNVVDIRQQPAAPPLHAQNGGGAKDEAQEELEQVTERLAELESHINSLLEEQSQLLQRQDVLKNIIDNRTALININHNNSSSSLQLSSRDFAWTSETEDILHNMFHIPSWRTQQREAINAVLGGHDVFATFPAGGGKSLLYQLPAMYNRTNGISLIISPLLSLIHDQVGMDAGSGHVSAVTCIT